MVGEDIEHIARQEWDLIVIGGSMSAAQIVADASRRGLHTLAITDRGIGEGATSGSTRIAHGGVRYLEHVLDWGLVSEGVTEREIFFETAPNLVHEQEFLLPVYQGKMPLPKWTLAFDNYFSSRAARELFFVKKGLGLYDWFANRATGSERQHLDIGIEGYKELLKPEGLTTILQYTDGRFISPERFALGLFLEALETTNGALLTHSPVNNITFGSDGYANGVSAEYEGSSVAIRGKTIVNATGSQIDTFSQKRKTLLIPGVHAVVSTFEGADALGDHAITLPTVKNGKIKNAFMVPCEEGWVIGTTDDDPVTPQGAIDYELREDQLQEVFDSIRQHFPGFNLQPDSPELLYGYTGTRPLKKSRRGKTAASRRDLFHVQKGIITAAAKLTASRHLAQRVVDKAIKMHGYHMSSSCETHTRKVFYAGAADADASLLAKINGISKNVAEHLLQVYGEKVERVLKYVTKDAKSRQVVHSSLPYTFGELAYIRENELVKHSYELFLDRTTLGRGKRLDDCVVREFIAADSVWKGRAEKEFQQYKTVQKQRYIVA